MHCKFADNLNFGGLRHPRTSSMATPLRADDEIAGGLYEIASDHSPTLPIEMIIPRMGFLLDFLMIKTRELSQS